MPIGATTRRWLRRGLVLVLVTLVASAGLTLTVPRIIAGQIERRVGGRVAFDGWWLGWQSGGVRGLRLHESHAADAPVWAQAERVTTDLSLAGFLRGRFVPGRLDFHRPAVTIRLDESGKPFLKFPGRPPGEDRLPTAIVRDGQLTFAQAGRPPLTVRGIAGALTATEGAGGRTGRFQARADDPTWGPILAECHLAVEPAPTAQLTVQAPQLLASAEAAACLPFVPAETWQHVTVIGPVSASLNLQAPRHGGGLPDVVVVVQSQGTAVSLPELGLDLSDASGQVKIHNDQVEIRDLQGRSLDGQAEVSGKLDFATKPPRLNLGLRLKNVDVQRTPETWQLQDAGLTGRLSGSAHLRIALDPEGARLDGSTGQGVLTGGTLGQIPFKSLKLSMRAERDTIRYDTGPAEGPSSWRWPSVLTPGVFIALQVPAPAPAPAQQPAEGPKRPAFVLPKSISTHVEFEDVDLDPIIARAQALGIVLPFAASGRLSIKADATIPLGQLRDLKAYAFRGSVTLAGSHVAGIDLGRVTADLNLADGVLELTRIQGLLIDRPRGSLLGHPAATPAFKDALTLPPGGFRGRLRAELQPRGQFTAEVVGRQVPLAELVAPVLPRPTPVNGLVSGSIEVKGDLTRAADPAAWDASGRLRAERITYRRTVLDTVAADLTIAAGRLTIEPLTALLAGQPLKLVGGLDLKPPFAFQATMETRNWDLDRLLTLIPSLPEHTDLGGRLTLRAQGSGTLDPLEVVTEGRGGIASFSARKVAFGNVPVRWSTTDSAIVITIPEAQPLGARFTAEATAPRRGRGPITGRAAVSGLDLARLGAVAPVSNLPLTGLAQGQGTFAIVPVPDRPGAAPTFTATARLQAPGLTVRGVPMSALLAQASLKEGQIDYSLAAEGLGGRVRLAGQRPWTGDAPTDLHAQAAGFALGPELWRALELAALADLGGQGAINANVRISPAGAAAARGFAEFRDLVWGRSYPLGRMRATFALTPQGWGADPLEGELFGGTVHATASSEPPPAPAGSVRFDLQVERAELSRLLAFEPALAGTAQGTASLRLAGRLDPALRADGELRVPRGQILGLPLSELRAPVTLSYVPASSAGSLDLARWSARFGGGRVQGTVRTRLGQARGFQSEIELADLDLETVNRVLSDTARPSSGKIGGRITLQGNDRAAPSSYQGRVDLTLSDASLGDVPILRALDRFLGGQTGGVFERGQLRGVLNGRGLEIEEGWLQGRIVQLHVQGNVAYNQELDLIVLVNTNQLIPQTGAALLALIPGVNQLRGAEATQQVAGFLSNKLLKFRVTGTVRNPVVNLDPTIAVTSTAVGFFVGVFKLPLNLLR